MGDTLTALVSGLLVMGYAVAGLFFLRFRRETRDRLFGIFAGAFWLLALQRLLLALLQDPDTEQVWLYGVRLLAFVLILGAIIDKNRGAASR
jgi:peptidoglycan/LPS O-acetylase OafA/YrhL